MAAGSLGGRNGMTHARFEQRIGGLPAHGAYAKAAFDADGNLVHLIDQLAATAGKPVAAAQVDAPAHCAPRWRGCTRV